MASLITSFHADGKRLIAPGSFRLDYTLVSVLGAQQRVPHPFFKSTFIQTQTCLCTYNIGLFIGLKHAISSIFCVCVRSVRTFRWWEIFFHSLASCSVSQGGSRRWGGGPLLH